MNLLQPIRPSFSRGKLLPDSREIVLIIVIALIYWIIAQLSLTFTFTESHTSVIWPPSGLAIGIVVIMGYQFWPAILFGSFAVNLITNILDYGEFELTVINSVALGIALSNTIEALLGARLINRFAGGLNCFERAIDSFWFVIVGAFVPPFFSAGGGVLSLCIFGFTSWDLFPHLFLIWYAANVVGILIVTPILFILKRPLYISWTRMRIFEGICLLGLLIILALATCSISFSSLLEGWPKSYMVIPKHEYPNHFSTSFHIYKYGFR